MNETQRTALKACLPDLVNDLNLEIQLFLQIERVFNQNDLDLIKAEITEQEQRLKLLEIVQARDKGWPRLLDALKHHDQAFLVDKLQAALLTSPEISTKLWNVPP